ncbi:hypothetical protein N9043_00330 [bacterium]|nr:hypothetical protein [bacterium]
MSIILRKYIKGYLYPNYTKVVIGKERLEGLIMQRDCVGPLYFYTCEGEDVIKYRAYPEIKDGYATFEMIRLKVFPKKGAGNKDHYNFIIRKNKELANQEAADMVRMKLNTLVKTIKNKE